MNGFGMPRAVTFAVFNQEKHFMLMSWVLKIGLHSLKSSISFAIHNPQRACIYQTLRSSVDHHFQFRDFLVTQIPMLLLFFLSFLCLRVKMLHRQTQCM